MHFNIKFKAVKKQRILKKKKATVPLKPPPKKTTVPTVVRQKRGTSFPTPLLLPTKPPFLSPFIGNTNTVASIEALFKQKQPFVLYVHGPIGVGKSELIRLLSKGYQYNVVTPEKRYLSQQWKMRRRGPTILNFDDIQSLNEHDQGLIQELSKFISRPTPCVVYISSSTDAKFKSLKFLTNKKVATIVVEKRLYRPSSRDLRPRFGNTIVSRCRGDVRQAQILKQETDMASCVDARFNSFDVCKSILDQQCKGALAAVDILKKSDGFGKVLLQENYLQNYLNVDDMHTCANAFSEMYLQQTLGSTALPMTLYLHQHGDDTFFHQFKMSMPRRRKRNPLSVADIRKLIFKVNGPYQDSIEAQTMYLCVLGQRFKQMSMKERKAWKKKYGITQEEQVYMLNHSRQAPR